MNSHQIGHTAFYHPWQQTVTVLHSAELQMTPNLQTSPEIYHMEQRVWTWIFVNVRFVCCHCLRINHSKSIIERSVCSIFWGGSTVPVLYLYSRTCQCVWRGNTPWSLTQNKLGDCFFFFHRDILLPNDSSHLLHHMKTTPLYLPLTLSPL